MLTVLESITLSTEYLQKKGIESARLNAEMLLAEILDCRRLDLYLRFERPLNDKEKSEYREFIRRRGNGEPVQYILGHTEFFGMKFFVNPSVLIPRPETEILVERVVSDIDSSDSIDILDIGTGSGNIAIAIGKAVPSAKITAIDISEESLEMAKSNAAKNNVENVSFKHADIFCMPDNFGNFDIVVSNPPYVSSSDYQTLQKEIVDFEPAEAVTDNGDGYKFFQAISEYGSKILKPGGKLYFETAMGQTDHIAEIMKKSGISGIEIVNDLQEIDRVILGVLE